MIEYVTRTVYRTIIECVRGEKIEGFPDPVFTQLEPLEISSKLTEEQALKAAIRHHGSTGIVVTKVTNIPEIRGLPLEQFMAESIPMMNYREPMPEPLNLLHVAN